MEPDSANAPDESSVASGPSPRTGGLAVLVLGLSAVMIPVLMVLLPLLSKATTASRNIENLARIGALTQATLLYAQDNQGRLPPPERWGDALAPLFQSKTLASLNDDRGHAGWDYGFNSNVAGLKLAMVATNTVLFFQLDSAARNVTAGPERLKISERRTEGVAISFADGHAELMRSDRKPDLRWVP